MPDNKIIGIDIGGTFTDFVSYDAATGTNLGLLPANAPVQAIDADSQKAYVLAPLGILPVDLTTYVP